MSQRLERCPVWHVASTTIFSKKGWGGGGRTPPLCICLRCWADAERRWACSSCHNSLKSWATLPNVVAQLEGIGIKSRHELLFPQSTNTVPCNKPTTNSFRILGNGPGGVDGCLPPSPSSILYLLIGPGGLAETMTVLFFFSFSCSRFFLDSMTEGKMSMG